MAASIQGPTVHERLAVESRDWCQGSVPHCPADGAGMGMSRAWPWGSFARCWGQVPGLLCLRVDP